MELGVDEGVELGVELGAGSFLKAATTITESVVAAASAEKAPVAPAVVIMPSAINNPTSDPVFEPESDLSYHVFEAGSVVTATVPLEATLGLLTASNVILNELSP